MVAIPLLEETTGGAGAGNGPSGCLIHRLSIYPASAGFELVEELDFLCARTIEPNVFFNPHFLAPAMPRLDDREVRLAVIRDGAGPAGRLRLLVPFSVERPPIPVGVAVMRTWANPFGPLGTPLLDRDDPAGVVDDFLAMLSRPRLKLPGILMLPEMRMDGPAVSVFRAVAARRGLPLIAMGEVQRPVLESDKDAEIYLRNALGSHRAGEYRRLKRRLEEQGDLRHGVARGPEDIRPAIEGFLALEASGWKGRRRTAMAADRYRAAFAREASHGLAEHDLCRVHSLTLDGRLIASLIVFVEAGIAYTWKTAYDEAYAAFSPGTLLMIEVTRQHLADPDIRFTDSCAAPDHPMISKLWTERKPVGTLLVGLSPEAGRLTRRAASQIRLYREARSFARLMRERVGSLITRR